MACDWRARSARAVARPFDADERALRYYTDLQPVRWDWLQPGDFAQLRRRGGREGLRNVRPARSVRRGEGGVDRAGPQGPGSSSARVRDVKLWQLE